LHKFPFACISVPDKDFWSQTDRRKEWLKFYLSVFLFQYAAATLLFIVLVFAMVFETTRTQQEFNYIAFFVLLTIYLGLIVGVTVLLNWWIKRQKKNFYDDAYMIDDDD